MRDIIYIGSRNTLKAWDLRVRFDHLNQPYFLLQTNDEMWHKALLDTPSSLAVCNGMLFVASRESNAIKSYRLYDVCSPHTPFLPWPHLMIILEVRPSCYRFVFIVHSFRAVLLCAFAQGVQESSVLRGHNDGVTKLLAIDPHHRKAYSSSDPMESATELWSGGLDSKVCRWQLKVLFALYHFLSLFFYQGKLLPNYDNGASCECSFGSLL